jgi:hypothetical protein
MTTTIKPPAGFLASELASHDWIRDLPQDEKTKLAELLLDGTAIAGKGAIYNEIADIYMKLYQLEAALRCAIPSIQSGDRHGMETTYLVADLIGQMAEKLDLLSHRI